MSLRLALGLIFTLGCESPPESPPPGGIGSASTEALQAVMGSLEDLDRAHAARDKDGARSAWHTAYIVRFEPWLEQPLRGVVDSAALLELEYLFGRLGAALERSDRGPVVEINGELERALGALESHVAPPAPPPGSEPTAHGESQDADPGQHPGPGSL